jgi:hypothetical protein
MTTAMLQEIRRWFEVLLVIFVAGLLIWFIFFRPPTNITLPSGASIKASDLQKQTNTLLGEIKKQNKRINDLESQVRQQQNKTVEKDIPEALQETDAEKSMQRMKDHW